MPFLNASFLQEVSKEKSLWILGTVVLLLLTYKYTTSTDIPFIDGIPEIPGSLPVFGHLLSLGEDHATICEHWARRYNYPIFQIRLGNTRAIVVNTFDSAKRMLITHQSAVADRPRLYTFHGVISSTKGFTIGTSPYDESCKNRRKAAGAALARPMLRSYYEMFDLESYCILRDLDKDSEGGRKEISVYPYLQRYALNTALTLCYGIRMDSVYDQMLKEITAVGSAISLLRSTSENYQDYIPILRYFPQNRKRRQATELRARRDAYLATLLDKAHEMIAQGTDRPCVSSAILKDEETKLSSVEVSSVCMSLVSGSFESLPGTITGCIGSLSIKEGQIFQEKAYAELKRHYPDIRDAWRNSFQRENLPYINALVKEAARYYTISPMSLPRKTMTDIIWDGARIPAKTMVLINAQAANHDQAHFSPDAHIFNPDRWITDPAATNGDFAEKPSEGLAHHSFGAGARACSGQNIAIRLLYTALIRLISSYKFVASETEPPTTDYVEYNKVKSALVAIPKEFKVRLIPREDGVLERCLKEGKERTKL